MEELDLCKNVHPFTLCPFSCHHQLRELVCVPFERQVEPPYIHIPLDCSLRQYINSYLGSSELPLTPSRASNPSVPRQNIPTSSTRYNLPRPLLLWLRTTMSFFPGQGQQHGYPPPQQNYGPPPPGNYGPPPQQNYGPPPPANYGPPQGYPPQNGYPYGTSKLTSGTLG